MSWFYSSLNEDKIGEIVGYDTAYGIWKCLRIVYKSLPQLELWGFDLNYRKL